MDFRVAGGFRARRVMFIPRDDTPKVNGSSGAFIAIIVVLALVVVLACTGIFLLLRFWDPSDAERNRRRRFSIRRRGAPTTDPLPIGLRDTGVAAGSLSEKLGNMFRGGRRHGSGWQVAPDDDDWASGDEELMQHRPERTSVGHAPTPLRRTIVEPDEIFVPPSHASPYDSASPSSPVSAQRYDDPFEPPYNPYANEEPSRRAHVVAESGTHFKEEV